MSIRLFGWTSASTKRSQSLRASDHVRKRTVPVTARATRWNMRACPASSGARTKRHLRVRGASDLYTQPHTLSGPPHRARLDVRIHEGARTPRWGPTRTKARYRGARLTPAENVD